MIVFTILPIFTLTKRNQTKYQIQSDVLTLVYDVPNILTILPMNRTSKTYDLEEDKRYILQNLFQDQLNEKKLTRKANIVIMDATIISENLSQKSSNKISSAPIVEHDNDTVIILTQQDSATTIHSTLQLPIDIFRTLSIEDVNISTNNKPFSSSSPSSFQLITPMPCIVNTYSTFSTSSMMMAKNYEAESALNKFISTNIVNELIFEKIIRLHGGSTIIIVYYIADRIRYADIMVNDLYPSITIIFPMMQHNKNIALLPIELNLCQGFNSIRIYNPDDFTPDFDRIVVY
ncbi:unnamed protein product [Rotaria magnacalcarata]|uniref:Uncharacterized protein n=1 Tax=Rotaria magnacalcarata TaxID=392030 RepID=A0A817ACP3_9BILA|nr:unnamed protein product [Rotaria magnacalcarata]CAF3843127.1 unnamed protein product [Rotaria magnacalcarata]CAF3843494.1 unnamed protein product [Rotaria magnacalcarata]CAF3869251.1 unnamed protein product [Rotaria magnacalcarata]